MRKPCFAVRGFVAACLVLAAVLMAGSPVVAADRYALIYNGIGATEGGPEGLAAIAGKIGLPVRYVAEAAELPGLLKNAALFGIGGTEDNTEPMRKSFTPEIMEAIREYVRQGGRYAGICGGGYFASRGWEEKAGFVEGFGLIPADSEVFGPDYDPHIITVQWLGKPLAIFYQGGPEFGLEESIEAVEVVAVYEGGAVASLLCSYGRGKVWVSGPHPEADESWLEEDNLNGYNWRPTQGLAVDMMKDLMSDRILKQ